MTVPRRYTAFFRHHWLASGPLPQVASAVKSLIDQDPALSPLIFDDATGWTIAVNFVGSLEQVLRSLPNPEATSRIARPGEIIWPGEPAAEPAPAPGDVALLPRHWHWLDAQPGGCSAALQALVERTRLERAGEDRARAALEATDRVMRDLAGDLMGFEEASRMLYRRDRAAFEDRIAEWPGEVREYLLRLAEGVEWKEPVPSCPDITLL